MLRVLLGEPTGADEALAVAVIEANIDDLNPQVLAYAMERLMEAGALDVSLEPILMKKGRPGNLLRVIAKPEDRETLAQLIFAETSTLGLRIYTAERRVQARTGRSGDALRHGAHESLRAKAISRPNTRTAGKLALATGVALKHIIAEANYAYLNRSR